MKTPPFFQNSHRRRGVALILVLCFIVLITGLVVAYFSRTLATRQLSNASTSTAQAEMLAASATDVILGDLKAEIANGSIAVLPPAGVSAASTVYVPTRASCAVPQRNPLPAGTAAGAEPMPNLVRRSLRLDSPNGANAFPTPSPSPAPAPPSAPSSRASAAASDKPSGNGRYVSTARWNRHYLVPTVAPAASVDPSTPVAAFTAPDWVFVTAEKGPDVLSGPSKDPSGHVTVTGRYAYAIYDEGGLLDANQTGYPSASTQGHIGAKPGPSYADLTQLPTPAPAPAAAAILSSMNVDSLLGWRNYATLQAAGTFPSLQIPGGTATDLAYYNLFASNKVAPSSGTPNVLASGIIPVPLTVWQNGTDQRFLSRQQLIGYFTAAGLDLRYLQYLGTFSRGLNQPSYLPEHSATALSSQSDYMSVPGQFPRPVRPQAQGGNDSYSIFGINPSFLTARVGTTFKRYDRTDAIVGEPLVKKRFPLNRLAWLTYRGPSHDRNTSSTDTDGADADIGYLKKYGITKEWLDEGTAANILTYFGLQWNGADKWSYVHGTSGTNGAILNVSNPSKGIDVARLNGPLGSATAPREPDFFELLKAAINPGSIAKTSVSPSIASEDQKYAHAAQDQYKLDTSVDRAILQIGANIIDQFDTDGFPTVIHYDTASVGGLVSALPFVCGDENVPFISRVRSGLLHLAEADPVETQDPTLNAMPIKNTGIAALMNYPEVWNLHDWGADVKQTQGAIAPKLFKIFARANDGDGYNQATTMFVWNQFGNNSCDLSTPVDRTASPGFETKYKFKFGTLGSNAGGEARHLSEQNTVMTFVVNPTAAGAALFREPTLLYAPGIPKESALASTTLVSTNNGNGNTDNGLGYLLNNPSFFNGGTGGGLLSSGGASTGYNTVPKLNAPYIGFYIGAEPMRFSYGGTSSPHYQTQYGPSNDVIYTLACEDGLGGYISYDVKPVTTGGQPNASLQQSTDMGSGFNGTYDLDYGSRYYQVIDPRTARFGMFDPWVRDPLNKDSIPPRKNYSGTLSATNTATGASLRSDREGMGAGTGMFAGYLSGNWFPNSMGWYPSGVKNSSDSFRPGLLEQNNPLAGSDGVISTATPALPATWKGGTSSPFFYADADGVVRRAMGGSVDVGSATSNPTGLPMATAGGKSSGTSAGLQVDSRPAILNRPFRSVAELGSVYSGTPWKNLDFFQPESGNVALLDVFCVNDNSDSNALLAGQVNLNTHQAPVLQAILSQASKDQWNDASSTAAASILGTPGAQQAQQLAQLLVNRTTVGVTNGPNAGLGPQPLQNVSDLVGRWVKPVTAPSTSGSDLVYDGKESSDGFTRDLNTFLDSGAGADLQMHNVQRFGESTVRALANAGQTRVWNLLFDIVAQTGRFPSQAATLDQFNVEGEQHYWVHVALDRYTGQILDKQVEVIKE